jgi:hypothetical protein
MLPGPARITLYNASTSALKAWPANLNIRPMPPSKGTVHLVPGGAFQSAVSQKRHKVYFAAFGSGPNWTCRIVALLYGL